jgi:hypothetical protein
MVALGELVTVKLPAHVTDRYNADYPANKPVPVGTERPALVVAVNDETQQANIVIFHDGDLVHYVQNAPYKVLTAIGETPVVSPASTHAADETPYTDERAGTGETYSGAGPYSPHIGNVPPLDQSPQPGEPVQGGVHWQTETAAQTEPADAWDSGE